MEAEALSGSFKSVTTPCGLGVLERGGEGSGKQPLVLVGIGADPCVWAQSVELYILGWRSLRSQKYVSGLRRGHTSERLRFQPPRLLRKPASGGASNPGL